MIAAEQRIRSIILLLIAACLWLSNGVLAHPSATGLVASRMTPDNSLRSRRPGNIAALREDDEKYQQYKHRDLNKNYDPWTIQVAMPELTLLLRGLSGESLGEVSYEVLETAMNDYLYKRFEQYPFGLGLVFVATRSRVVGDVPFEGYNLAGGNAVSLEVTLKLRPKDDETVVPRISSLLQSELELDLAAGYAWNELGSFRHHLLVSAAIESLDAFDGLESIDSMAIYPEREPAGGEGNAAAAEEIEDGGGEGSVAAEDAIEDEDEEEQEDGISNDGDSKEPLQQSVVLAASSPLDAPKETNQWELNLLWPILLVGSFGFWSTFLFYRYIHPKHGGKIGSGGTVATAASTAAKIEAFNSSICSSSNNSILAESTTKLPTKPKSSWPMLVRKQRTPSPHRKKHSRPFARRNQRKNGDGTNDDTSTNIQVVIVGDSTNPSSPQEEATPDPEGSFIDGLRRMGALADGLWGGTTTPASAAQDPTTNTNAPPGTGASTSGVSRFRSYLTDARIRLAEKIDPREASARTTAPKPSNLKGGQTPSGYRVTWSPMVQTLQPTGFSV